MTPTHELKSWTGLFQPIWDVLKTHDLRVLDRNYNVGDICLLREYDPTERAYTGRAVLVEVTHTTSEKHSPCAFSPIALHPAMGCLSIRLLGRQAAGAGMQGLTAPASPRP